MRRPPMLPALLLSFILIALIMMNLLEVRRDVLLPTQLIANR